MLTILTMYTFLVEIVPKLCNFVSMLFSKYGFIAKMFHINLSLLISLLLPVF